MQFVSARRRGMQGHFPHRRAAQTEFLEIAQASEIVLYKCLSSRTMNHVKQRVAKDMSAACELVRA